MTGIAAEAALEINGKRLQILKEIVPDLNRVAVLRDVADRMAAGLEWTALDEAARQLGLTLMAVDTKTADELETAFASMKKREAEALFLTRTALIFVAGKQMAATLKEGADEGDNTWSEFALVARDLAGESFLDGIPLARRIAAATVEAFEQR